MSLYQNTRYLAMYFSVCTMVEQLPFTNYITYDKLVIFFLRRSLIKCYKFHPVILFFFLYRYKKGMSIRKVIENMVLDRIE